MSNRPYKDIRDEYLSSHQNDLAKEGHVPISTSCQLVRQAVYEAYGGRCFYTGTPIAIDEFEIDHFVPKARNGKDCFTNFVASRRDINRAKSDFLEAGSDAYTAARYLVVERYGPKASKSYKLLKAKAEAKIEARVAKKIAPKEEWAANDARGRRSLASLLSILEQSTFDLSVGRPTADSDLVILQLKLDMERSGAIKHIIDEVSVAELSCVDNLNFGSIIREEQWCIIHITHGSALRDEDVVYFQRLDAIAGKKGH